MTAKIWFLPSGADRQVEIDFGRSVLIEGPTPYYNQAIRETLSGVQSTVVYSGRSQITLSLTWNRGTQDASGDGSLLRRKLATLESHLLLGGICTFAGDATYARAGFATVLPASNASSVRINVDLFKNLNPIGNVISGREIWIQTDCDRYRREMKLCNVNSGRDFTLTQNLATDMTRARWVLLREAYTYPALRLPQESRSRGGFIAHDHEAIFRMDLPLEEDPSALDALEVFGTPIAGTGHGPTVIHMDPQVPHQDGPGGPVYPWKG